MSVAEASSADSASHNENGLQRRNSIERYRPGALFSEDREKQREEREKARQRGHFGEKRLNLDINKANGHRGRGRGRGGGRGSALTSEYIRTSFCILQSHAVILF